MHLSSMFSKPLITAGPKETLASVALQMQEHNVGSVVIQEDGKPVGIVTDRDLALALGAQGLHTETAVERVMTGHPYTIDDDAGIFTAAKHMRDHEVRRLPVVDKRDRLVGIISLDDLLHVLGRELYNLSEVIRSETVVK